MYQNTRIKTLSMRATCVAIACLLLVPGIKASTLRHRHRLPSPRAQLVEANIIAVHAYQIMLARKAGTSNACYPDTVPDTAALQALVDHQRSLLAEPTEQVARWADVLPSSFDPAKDLLPLLDARLILPPNLPVNVFTRYLHTAAPQEREERIRSVANLYQTVLEVDRDGDLLQDLYRFYIALKLPVYVGQFGLPGSDADFLAVAQKLTGNSCTSPFDLSVPAWQVAGRKIWNWGEKNMHIRDANTVAKELLADPEIAKLIPAMRAMPAEKIVVLGHSFTMDIHWSSPSAFVPIVTAMFAMENPHVQFWQGSAGGQTYSRAYKNFYSAALASRPDLVLFVLTNRTPEDAGALKTMAAGFRAAGARVLMFDDVEDPVGDSTVPQKTEIIARAAGVEIVPARAILDAAPNHDSFPCMDGIHKKEPYHRLMASLWLKAILAANKPAPPVALQRLQPQPAAVSTTVADSNAADAVSR